MSMVRTRDVLRRLEIASPCTVPWDSMRGDDKVRFCGKCRLHVYNLSAMNDREALSLVAHREHRLCVRFYRRPDGTVLTRDCGAAARRVARVMFAAICTFLALAIAGTAAGIETWLTEVRWPRKGQLSLAELAPTMGAPVAPPTTVGTPMPVPEVGGPRSR
jgi:hypothetical protein